MPHILETGDKGHNLALIVRVIPLAMPSRHFLASMSRADLAMKLVGPIPAVAYKPSF
jgi:hypothetical protein